jgi:hypothetical protein
MREMTRRSTSLLGALLLLAACSKKAPECDSITKTINPVANKLEKAGAALDKTDAPAVLMKAMNDMAQLCNGAAADLAKLPLTVPELQKFSTDYQGLMKDAAGAARTAADLAKSYADADKASTKNTKDIEASAERLTKACANPKAVADAKSCEAFGDLMAKFPADTEKTAESEKIAGELSRITWKGDETRASAMGVVAAIRATNKLVADLKVTEAKSKEAEKAFDAVDKKEQALIKEINSFCAP